MDHFSRHLSSPDGSGLRDPDPPGSHDPLCDLCDAWATVATFAGPRCGEHADVIAPDAFALEAIEQS